MRLREPRLALAYIHCPRDSFRPQIEVDTPDTIALIYLIATRSRVLSSAAVQHRFPNNNRKTRVTSQLVCQLLKLTYRVAEAAAGAACWVAAERTGAAAAARTGTPLATLARSHSSQTRATSAAEEAPQGSSALWRPAALDVPTRPRSALCRTPWRALSLRPALGHAAAPSGAPSRAAGQPSADTSRKCSTGICSSACVPSARPWACGCGSERSWVGRGAQQSWRRPVRSVPRSRRARGASTRPRTPWSISRRQPFASEHARPSRRAVTGRLSLAAAPPRPAPLRATLLHLLRCRCKYAIPCTLVLSSRCVLSVMNLSTVMGHRSAVWCLSYV